MYVSEPKFTCSNLDAAFLRILIIMKRAHKASTFVVLRSSYLNPDKLCTIGFAAQSMSVAASHLA